MTPSSPLAAIVQAKSSKIAFIYILNFAFRPEDTLESWNYANKKKKLPK